MSSKLKHITVIGDGAWGTTLAIHLAKKKYPVTLWGPFAENIQQMKQTGLNSKFLPGIKIPQNVYLSNDLKSSLIQCDVIVFAIPSQFTVNVLKEIKKTKVKLSNKILLSVTKGIDTKKLLRISTIIQKELGKISVAVLSGPTIAMEVANEIASTAVVACKSHATAQKLQTIFNSNTFRIYTNTDVVGVEIGGSVKNVIAVACGVCDGLGLGTNTKAAIVTRGLAEMIRLGEHFGAKAKTFAGLTGLGDLVTTCFSPKSRNRFVGEELGKGKSINQILSKMDAVAEGVETVKAVHRLSHKYKIPMPISNEIYQIIYQKKHPAKALTDLMSRKTKAE